MSSVRKCKKESKKARREHAFKILFSAEFLKDYNDALEKYLEIEDVKEQDREEIKERIILVENNLEYFENTITKFLKPGWSYERLSKTAKAILKLAMVEIKFLNIDYKLAINEAVEIAKTYSTEKESKLINGILATYIRKEKEEEEK